jgi:glutamate dehydrogenase
VLEDNRLQALGLSIAERGGPRAVAAQLRLIETLEDSGDLDRRTEGLADNEALARRAADGHGLTRPELAVLLSSAKLKLQAAIEASDLAGDDAAEPLLVGKFPEAMQGPFRKRILGHRLRNEIVATVVANKVVNRLGMVHPFELAEEEGAGLDRVAGAFVGACGLLGVDAIWQAIETASMPEGARLQLFERTASAMRGHMADLLRAGGAIEGPAQLVGEVSEGVAELVDHVDDLLADEARGHAQAIAADLVQAGAPAEIAAMVANLFAVDGSIGLARLARDTGIAPMALTRAFSDLGERLGLDWAQQRASVMIPSDPWERLLVAGLARDFQRMRFEFIRGLASGKRAKGDPEALIAAWAAAREPAIRQFRAMIGRAQAANPLAPAMLAQIASQARNLLQR